MLVISDIVYIKFFEVALCYTNEEKFYIVKCFIENRKAALALNNYAGKYPESQQPDERFFPKLVVTLRT